MEKMLVSKACWHKEFLKFELNTDAGHLIEYISSICKLLSKKTNIVELFSADPANFIMSETVPIFLANKNMTYYVCDDIQHLLKIEFVTLRYCCICSADSYPSTLNHTKLIYGSSFSLCWDNYVESSELMIRKRDYSDSILKRLYFL